MLGGEGTIAVSNMKAEVDAGSREGRKKTRQLPSMSHSYLSSQVSRLTWFTRHEPVVQKDPVPPATPLSLPLPQNGTTEATSTSIQLETVEETKSKAHSGELSLVSGIGELMKHYACRSVRSPPLKKGEGFEIQHPLAF